MSEAQPSINRLLALAGEARDRGDEEGERVHLDAARALVNDPGGFLIYRNTIWGDMNSDINGVPVRMKYEG